MKVRSVMLEADLSTGRGQKTFFFCYGLEHVKERLGLPVSAKDFAMPPPGKRKSSKTVLKTLTRKGHSQKIGGENSGHLEPNTAAFISTHGNAASQVMVEPKMNTNPGIYETNADVPVIVPTRQFAAQARAPVMVSSHPQAGAPIMVFSHPPAGAPVMISPHQHGAQARATPVMVSSHPQAGAPVVVSSHPQAGAPVVVSSHPPAGAPVMVSSHPTPLMVSRHPQAGAPVIFSSHPQAGAPVMVSNHPQARALVTHQLAAQPRINSRVTATGIIKPASPVVISADQIAAHAIELYRAKALHDILQAYRNAATMVSNAAEAMVDPQRNATSGTTGHLGHTHKTAVQARVEPGMNASSGLVKHAAPTHKGTAQAKVDPKKNSSPRKKVGHATGTKKLSKGKGKASVSTHHSAVVKPRKNAKVKGTRSRKRQLQEVMTAAKRRRIVLSESLKQRALKQKLTIPLTRIRCGKQPVFSASTINHHRGKSDKRLNFTRHVVSMPNPATSISCDPTTSASGPSPLSTSRHEMDESSTSTSSLASNKASVSTPGPSSLFINHHETNEVCTTLTPGPSSLTLNQHETIEATTSTPGPSSLSIDQHEMNEASLSTPGPSSPAVNQHAALDASPLTPGPSSPAVNQHAALDASPSTPCPSSPTVNQYATLEASPSPSIPDPSSLPINQYDMNEATALTPGSSCNQHEINKASTSTLGPASLTINHSRGSLSFPSNSAFTINLSSRGIKQTAPSPSFLAISVPSNSETNPGIQVAPGHSAFIINLSPSLKANQASQDPMVSTPGVSTSLPSGDIIPSFSALTVKPSTILGAGLLGVFATQFIPKRARVGFCKLQLIAASASSESSNWMSLVNCARTKEDQNLMASYVNGHVCYHSWKDIPVGAELLVWSQDQCAGANLCVSCASAFESEALLQLHLNETRECSQGCEETLTCQKCDQRFSKIEALQEHARRHILVKAVSCPKPVVNSCKCGRRKCYKCKECERCYDRQSYLRAHLLTHSEAKQFECEECEKQFSLKGSLLTHLRTHLGAKKNKCIHCGARFTFMNGLAEHLKLQSSRTPYVCETCGESFGFKCALRKHARTHEDGVPEEESAGSESDTPVGILYKCERCGWHFSRKSSLVKHLQTCKQLSDESGQRSGTLQSHHQTHQDSSKQPSGKDGQRSNTLQGHLQLQQLKDVGSQPSDQRSSTLQTHQDICKQSSDEKKQRSSFQSQKSGKKFKCESCGSCFSSERQLLLHSEEHVEKKQFQCEDCKMQFGFSANLVQHLKLHSNIKIAKAHLEMLSKKKLYRCHECGKSFCRKDDLVVHSMEHRHENAAPNAKAKVSTS